MSLQALTGKQVLSIDASHSSVEFSVRHLMISTVRGRFGAVEGTVTRGEAGWSAEASIDATSIDTRNEMRDEHLRNSDFFEVEKHPKILFRSTTAGEFSAPGDSFRVTGDLTILGTTRPVVLDAVYNGAGKDPWGGERLSFSATTKIDRRDFGLTYNQALEAGGVALSHEISIQIEVELVKQA
ncbi:MAG: YceI family protein [Gemmatimonadota bacterium]|jgi:polyisoprenoid-binding protein YceI|nr:YceI family protein [Gemmatimonadota bacterium]